MATRLPKPVDYLISVSGLAIVLVGLTVLDPRVQLEAGRLLSGEGARSGAALYKIASMIAVSAWDLVLAHGPLALFSLVALLLVAVMLRT